MKKMITNYLGRILAAVAVMTAATALADAPHVYVNPGHGGHSSDDRNVVVAPFTSGDTAGFYESNSNLAKGFALREILWKKGYTVTMSRVANTDDDDLALSTIVALSNASGADVFYAIHSNATGAGEGYRINYPMGLYRGYTGQPEIAGSDSLTEALGVYLIANKTTVWTTERYYIYGDWTFYPSWGDKVGLGVLRGNKVVSMLDEGSFHDYIPETYRLLNKDYCWLEGWNFSLGADRYFNRLDQFTLGAIAGNVRDSRLERGESFVMHGDDNLMPIHNATVTLYDKSGNVVQTTMTDTLRNGIYVFRYVEPGDYRIIVTEPLHYPDTADITVTANAPTYQNFYLNRVRNTPPRVINYSPVWNEGDAPVMCNVPVVLEFNWDMDPETTEAAFSISPEVEGTIEWQDTNYRMVFRPTDAFDINTLYTVKLARTAQHAGGTPMEEDFTMSFLTQGRNHIDCLAMFPYQDAPVHYTKPYMEFRTDSMLATKDLFKLLHIYDASGNELDWNKRNIKYNKSSDPYGYIRLQLSKDLTAGDQYRAVVEMATSDTAGLHLAGDIEVNFTAVDAGAAKDEATVIEPFETLDPFAIDSAACVDYNTAAVSLVTDKLFGDKALQLKYEFTSNDGKVAVNCTPTTSQPLVAGNTLGLHIWGDMSFDTLKVRLTSGSTRACCP